MLFVLNITVGVKECFECVMAEYSWCLICSLLCVHIICRNVLILWSWRRFICFAFIKSCIVCWSPKYSHVFLRSHSLLIKSCLFVTFYHRNQLTVWKQIFYWIRPKPQLSGYFLFLSLTVQYRDYGLDRPWFESRQGLEIYVVSKMSRLL